MGVCRASGQVVPCTLAMLWVCCTTLHALMASIVSGRSVAIGFSQKTCLPAAAHALIWSAWKLDGEQIHTASTSGWLITCIVKGVSRGSRGGAGAHGDSLTSMSSPVQFGTLNFLAAASALLTVGFEMMTARGRGCMEGWGRGLSVEVRGCRSDASSDDARHIDAGRAVPGRASGHEASASR